MNVLLTYIITILVVTYTIYSYNSNCKTQEDNDELSNYIFKLDLDVLKCQDMIIDHGYMR